MNLFLASLVWVIIGVLLGVGIYAVFLGKIWPLVVVTAGFVFVVGKIGCSQ